MRIIIYGMGANGRRLLKDLEEVDEILITAITDSNYLVKDKLEKTIQNLFLKPEELENIDFDYVIVSNEKFYTEIKNGLIKLNLNGKKVITVKELNDLLSVNTKLRCGLCGKPIFKWLRVGCDYDLFNKKRIIGGGVRSCKCPNCGSSDRERAQIGILRKFTDIFEGNKKILHMAPESNLECLLRDGNEYISGDLVEGRADMVADIIELPFEDNKFDYIICNHVLEHIPNEKKAFREMFRCINMGRLSENC
jgi:hypothetical protein